MEGITQLPAAYQQSQTYPHITLVPEYPVLLAILTAAYALLYHLISPYYASDHPSNQLRRGQVNQSQSQLLEQREKRKQRSWIITACASASMTLASLPYARDYLRAGASVYTVNSTHTKVGADLVCVAFQAYLLADLGMGSIHYRDQIQVLSGWIHHSAYVFVVEYAIRHGLAPIFVFCAVMELPTLIMALGILAPSMRSNFWFAASFFATRIVLHVLLLFEYAQADARNYLLKGSWAPVIILFTAFLLHVSWFYKCLKGNLRRIGKQYKVQTTAIVSSKGGEDVLGLGFGNRLEDWIRLGSALLALVDTVDIAHYFPSKEKWTKSHLKHVLGAYAAPFLRRVNSLRRYGRDKRKTDRDGTK